MPVLTRNSRNHPMLPFINNGSDQCRPLENVATSNTVIPETSNVLILEQVGEDNMAAGVGVKRLEPCSYIYVPSLSDVKLPDRVIQRRTGEPVVYQAETDIWNKTEDTWLEYSWAGINNSVGSAVLSGKHKEIVPVTIIAKYRHKDGRIFEVARRTVGVTIYHEIFTLEIATASDGSKAFKYLDALEGLTPEEVQKIDFFKMYTHDNIVRLNVDGTIAYRLNRPSLATNFPLDNNGIHKPHANNRQDNGKFGNIMAEIPAFYYKWEDGERSDEEEQEPSVFPIKIVAGEHHSAVILSDGTLWTAGNNSNFQLARSTTREVLNEDGLPTGQIVFNPFPNRWGLVGDDAGATENGGGLVINYETHHVVDISCGFNHTVFIVEHRNNKTRTVYSCGDNSFGQLGREPHLPQVPVAEIPSASINAIEEWHDGTPYNLDDNIYTSTEHTYQASFSINEDADAGVEIGYFVFGSEVSGNLTVSSNADDFRLANWRTYTASNPYTSTGRDGSRWKIWMTGQYVFVVEVISRHSVDLLWFRATWHALNNPPPFSMWHRIELSLMGGGSDAPILDNISRERFKIRSGECRSVECGSYHTHLIYPLGDPTNELVHPTVLINCGRNRNGELCRGFSGEGVNTLKAVMLGGTHTHHEPGINGGRLYPGQISSGVYHTVFTTLEGVDPPENINIAPPPGAAPPGKYWNWMMMRWESDEDCTDCHLLGAEGNSYEIHAVVYYDNDLLRGAHRCNNAVFEVSIETSTETVTGVINLNNAGEGEIPPGARSPLDRYGGEIVARLNSVDLRTDDDCMFTIKMRCRQSPSGNFTTQCHEGIEKFDIAIKNLKTGKWWYSRAGWIVSNEDAIFKLNKDVVFDFDFFHNYKTNAPGVWTECTHGKVYSVGTNHYGQLGRITENWVDDQVGIVNFNADTSGDIMRIETGWGSTAFVDTRNTLYTCGANYDEQLGNTKPSGTHMVSNLTSNNILVREVSMGYLHMLYTDENDNLWSWGREDHGVLLVDTPRNTANTGFIAKVIGTGYSYSGFATPDGDFYNAGNDEKGVLGR